MAKLPTTLIMTPKPQLKDMEVGDTVFVEPTAMRVTDELECFLNPDISFFAHTNVIAPLRVTRDRDGFHVAVMRTFTWRTDWKSVDGWLPTASIVDLSKD